MSQPPVISKEAGIGTATDAGVKKDVTPQQTQAVEQEPNLPKVSAGAVEKERLPQDPVAASKKVATEKQKVDAELTATKAQEAKLQEQEAALSNEMKADSNLASAEREVKEAQAEVKATKATKKNK